MKSKYLILVCLIILVLTSCPGMYKVPHYYSIIDADEKVIIPGETIEVFCVYSNQDNENKWKDFVNLYVNELYGADSYGLRCLYGQLRRLKEIKSVQYERAIFEVPLNVALSFSTSNMTFNFLERKNIIYPTKVILSKNEAHIGDVISIECTKPVFDIETFSENKVKLLEEIDYRPVWLKTRGDVNSWIGLPIADCTVNDPYRITFTIPDKVVSNQVLILNEGGFEYNLHPDFCDVEETKSKYINFNSTSCEKYAYYASKTELLILDASGDRVD